MDNSHFPSDFIFGVYLIIQSDFFIRLMQDDSYIVHENIWGVSKFCFVFGLMALIWLVTFLWWYATKLTFIRLSTLREPTIQNTIYRIIAAILFIIGLFALSLFSWWHEYVINNGSNWAIFWSSGIYEASLLFDALSIFVYIFMIFKIVRLSFNLILNLLILFFVKSGHIEFSTESAQLNHKKKIPLLNDNP